MSFKPNSERQVKVGIHKPHFFLVRTPFTRNLKWVCWQSGLSLSMDFTMSLAYHRFLERN